MWRVVIISVMKKLVDYTNTIIVLSYQQFHRSKLKRCNNIHMDQVLYVLDLSIDYEIQATVTVAESDEDAP